jgi:putative glutamine amidotransferase
MKPTIGLNCNLTLRDGCLRAELKQDYVRAVELAGGVPILLPVTDNAGHVEEQLDLVDGLVLTGGQDYAPKLYGAEPHKETKPVHPSRQFYDVELARIAIGRKVPVLAICGGHQLVNIVCGGSLLQHLPDVLHGAEEHDGEPGELIHTVAIEPDSMLARIVGAEEIAVNSTHHQAVDKIGGGLRIAAASPRGVIEALESKGGAFLLCVQWHPERLAADHREHLAVFEALIEASQEERDRA